MLCTNCYREAVASAVFCNHCGTQLQNICINCNSFNPLDSNFCSRCGSSLSLQSPAAEPSVPQQRQDSPVQSAACPRCRAVNEPRSAYCYSCGLPLDEIADAPQPSITQSPPYSTQVPTKVQHTSQSFSGQRAGFWVRLGANVIDIALISITSYVLVAILIELLEVPYSEWSGIYGYGYALGRATGSVLAPILPIGDTIFTYTETNSWTRFDYIDLTIPLAYITLAVSVWATTIGKCIFGLYVVRADGTKVGFGRALARYLCYTISTLTLGIGFLMIAFRQDKRGLHDLICDTMVVRR